NAGRPQPTGLTVEGHGAPAVAGSVVYAGFSDGYVEAYRLADGSRIGSRPLSFSGGEFVDADADPVVVDGHLYVASYSDGVYALDLNDGTTVWTRSAPAVVSLARVDEVGPAADGAVLAASADGWIWALG